MSVIAAVDFSDLSLRAARIADLWARKLGEPLRLVHVVWQPKSLPYEGGEDDASQSKADTRAADLALEQVRSDLARNGGDVTAHVLLGKAEDDLARFAREQSALFLVVGTRGWNGVSDLFIGSVAGRLVRLAPCPVLMVSGACVVPDQIPKGVLVASDLSEHSGRAATHAYRLAPHAQGAVEFLHVVKYTGERTDPGSLKRFEADLEKVIVLESPGEGVDSRALVVVGQSVSGTIVDTARERGVALTVVASHGRSGLVRALLGSVAEAVVRTSTVPVLVVGPQTHD